MVGNGIHETLIAEQPVEFLSDVIEQIRLGFRDFFAQFWPTINHIYDVLDIMAPAIIPGTSIIKGL
ncbi:hypothetical protein GALL_231750 [mine drainage metagenome]|uniref:Uncharacterized protein n=1 Tax=mine drainage metagenome TaxID=410659 RepID=A0A1J5RRW4_9ZZZZ